MQPNTSAATELFGEVAETLKSSAMLVRTRLKDALVQREIDNRVDTLDKALLKLREARKEIQKMKPDQVSFDTTGQKVETWSKDAHEKKQKAEEAATKLENAITTALGGESFDKLRELVK